MSYTRFKVRGTYRYMLDGKLISVKNIPAEELAKFEGKLEIVEPVKLDKTCLFCGQPGNYPRLVNLRSVDLCEEHYFNTNIGMIAQKLNSLEVSNA